MQIGYVANLNTPIAMVVLGSNVAVFAQLHNQDYTYAVKVVCASTIYSIITLPLLVAVASYLFGM